MVVGNLSRMDRAAVADMNQPQKHNHPARRNAVDDIFLLR